MDRTGLQAVGNPSLQDWIKCGEFLKNANGAVHFWIGDWMNYGEKHYGETYSQALDETGYSYGTLANDKWIASRVESSRRRENLSFSHHQEVADLMPEDQEILLAQAEEKHISSKDFRSVVRNYKLRLDLPELSQAQLSQEAHKDFEKAQGYVSMLIEVTEELSKTNLDAMNVDARDYLLSQVKKSIGKLGKLIV